jgi:hypothetical protein
MIDPPRRLAAAVTGAGVVLCVLGWYQISGQPTVAQQLPYLASATIPGAALLVSGIALLLRPSASREIGRARAPRALSAGEPGGAGPGEGAGALRRVPDGRYLHSADCPLLDGRTDLITVEEGEEASAEADAEAPGRLRPCPLCRAGADADAEQDPNG